jgi:hypothetical protein
MASAGQNLAYVQASDSIGRKHLSLSPHLNLIAYSERRLNLLTRKNVNNQPSQWGDIMAENRIEDYTDESNNGHVDTREANFHCEIPDEHLGCDPGIDVAG